MDEFIQSLSAKLNLPESSVRSGIGVLLNFLKNKIGAEEFDKLVAQFPGAASLLAAAPANASGTSGNGLFGGLLGSASGLFGGQAGEALQVAGALREAGISMDKALPLARQFFAEARKTVGPEVVDKLLNQVPALKNLLAE